MVTENKDLGMEIKVAQLGDSEETSTTECQLFFLYIRSKTGWEVQCSKDMQTWVEDFTLVKIIGRKPLEILVLESDDKLYCRKIGNYSQDKSEQEDKHWKRGHREDFAANQV